MLSAENSRALLIPEGFAHGFQALEDDCELLYLHSAAYEPSAEGGVNCTDARLGIDWPLPVSELSARDREHAPLGDDFEGLKPGSAGIAAHRLRKASSILAARRHRTPI